MNFQVSKFNLELSNSEAKQLLNELMEIGLETRGVLMDKILWAIKDYFDNCDFDYPNIQVPDSCDCFYDNSKCSNFMLFLSRLESQ